MSAHDGNSCGLSSAVRLTYFQPGTTQNFGDELNAFIWPRLLPPGFLDADESNLLIGFGSILYDSYPASAAKHILGAGYGGYRPAPDLADGSWNVVFVRGPRTASFLKLPQDSWITDGAVLLREAGDLPAPTPHVGVAFIPHFHNMRLGHWQDICQEAGVTLIDPRKPVRDILADMLGARLILAEAMHGAVIADSLRIPWVPMRPLGRIHHMKWSDWTDSLELPLRWTQLESSCLQEYIHHALPGRASALVTASLSRLGGLTLGSQALRRRAVLALKAAKRAPSCMSRDSVILDRTRRARSAVDRFVEQRLAPRRAFCG